MTDLEFEILDELYFVIQYDELLLEVDREEDAVKKGLKTLIDKGWVKCFSPENQEVEPENLNFDADYKIYYYLATKKGLFAHNSI